MTQERKDEKGKTRWNLKWKIKEKSIWNMREKKVDEIWNERWMTRGKKYMKFEMRGKALYEMRNKKWTMRRKKTYGILNLKCEIKGETEKSRRN